MMYMSLKVKEAEVSR